MADQYHIRPDLLAEPDWLWDYRHDPEPQTAATIMTVFRHTNGE